MTHRRLTTGLIPIPAAPQGAVRTVHVLLSNAGRTAAPVAVQVHRLEGGGTKRTVRSEHVIVPVGSAVRLALNDAAGETVEVNLETSSEHVRPSIGVVTAGSAGGADLSAWLGPGAFTELASAAPVRKSRGAGVRRTTGMLPVGASEGEFTPDFAYRLVLLVSNFTDATAEVPYTVSWAREPLGAKATLQEGALAVGRQGGAQQAAGNVEGRTVEAAFTLSGPGLVPTVAVVRENPQDGSGELLRVITAAQMARLPADRAATGAAQREG